jgi:hypothetical protein
MPHKQTDEEAKRAFTHGSSGATSDMASDPKRAIEEHRHIEETPQTRHVEPTPEGQKHDHLAEREAETEDRQEALLDEAIEETFPGSDPISPKHIT